MQVLVENEGIVTNNTRICGSTCIYAGIVATLYVTCHMWCVTCHMSLFFLFLDQVVKFIDGGSYQRAYPVYLC